jgi:hypothetical protein
VSLKSYYARQAATSRRLAEQAITHAVAQRLLSAANDYEQRARACEIEQIAVDSVSIVPDHPKDRDT